MFDDQSEKPVSGQTIEELLETTARLKLERLKNIHKYDEVIVELFERARGGKEKEQPN